MALQFTLSPQQKQELSLTPQLQQAISLLQLSHIELLKKCQEMIESNPLIDFDESSAEPGSTEKVVTDTIYFHHTTQTYQGSSQHDNIAERVSQAKSLKDHLQWQLGMAHLNDRESMIGNLVIDAIDEEGYLTCDMQSLSQSIHHGVKIKEIESVLQTIQSFEPVGVGAKNIQECLLLQLAQQNQENTTIQLCQSIIQDHFDDFVNHQYQPILQQTKAGKERLADAIEHIQTLNPRPGTPYHTKQAEYVVPDIVVERHNGRWQAMLNHEVLPKLKVSQQYNHVKSEREQNFVKQHMQEAKWWMKSIAHRNETLLKVARFIVEHQQDFFEGGDFAIKPMIISDLSTELDIHDSTISRVTTGKYMHTCRGVFELKYFFSGQVPTQTGEPVSAKAVQAHIKHIIQHEPAQKPFSDEKIREKLQAMGIDIARRTISKYREGMGFLSTTHRKKLK